jgi:hypothetical protein
MNKQFERMQKLAGILTEGYTDSERADNAHELGKSGEEHLFGAGVEKGEEIEKKKMSKAEAKQAIKDAILAEISSDRLAEAKKKKKEEEEEESDEDVDLDFDMDLESGSEDVTIDMDMNTTPDMDVSSGDAKNTFDDLAKAYQAAKGLGDEKLIQQLANTITYFNKNIILK